MLTEDVRDGVSRTSVMLEHLDDTVPRSERRLHRVGDSVTVPGTHDESIDDHRDLVILVPIQGRGFGEVVGLPVDPGTHEPLLARLFEELAELTLPSPNQRRQYLDPGILADREQPLHDLTGRLP